MGLHARCKVAIAAIQAVCEVRPKLTSLLVGAGMLPDERRPVHQLGEGQRCFRPAADRWGRRHQQRQLDVAVRLVLFLPVLPGVLARDVRQEVRQERRLCAALPASAEGEPPQASIPHTANASGIVVCAVWPTCTLQKVRPLAWRQRWKAEMALKGLCRPYSQPWLLRALLACCHSRKPKFMLASTACRTCRLSTSGSPGRLP